MGFTNQERINQAAKVLAAGVNDANEVAQWYESRFPNEFVLDGSRVWLQLGDIRKYPAATQPEARSNVAGPLAGIVEDRSGIGKAIRLTPVPGANGSTLAAYEEYSNFNSPHLKDWLQPQQVPMPSGAPSFGYSIRLFQGNPDTTGTEILTTAGVSGTGANKSVGWIWNYASGLLFLSADLRTMMNTTDLWVQGFRYIGFTAAQSGGGSGRIEQSLTLTTPEIAPGAYTDFPLNTSSYCLLLDLQVDKPCVVECHSTSARNDANPYQFTATGSFLSDQGVFVSAGNTYFGPRYVTLYNRENAASPMTYWRVFNTDTSPRQISLSIRSVRL